MVSVLCTFDTNENGANIFILNTIHRMNEKKNQQQQQPQNKDGVSFISFTLFLSHRRLVHTSRYMIVTKKY